MSVMFLIRLTVRLSGVASRVVPASCKPEPVFLHEGTAPPEEKGHVCSIPELGIELAEALKNIQHLEHVSLDLNVFENVSNRTASLYDNGHTVHELFTGICLPRWDPQRSGQLFLVVAEKLKRQMFTLHETALPFGGMEVDAEHFRTKLPYPLNAVSERAGLRCAAS